MINQKSSADELQSFLYYFRLLRFTEIKAVPKVVISATGKQMQKYVVNKSGDILRLLKSALITKYAVSIPKTITIAYA